MSKDLTLMVKNVENKFKYEFSDKRLIEEAITHSSIEKQNKYGKTVSNERLEFLGDAILDFIISEYLFKTFPDWDEGMLTKVRSIIVREESLAQCGRALDIGNNLYMSNAEVNNGGRDRDALIADAIEAIFAAIFLDSNYPTVKKIVLSTLKEQIEQAVSGNLSYDYKSDLQELLQAKGESNIEYVLIEENGPDHNKEFVFAVKINGKEMGCGKGKTKKLAQQKAAEIAYKKLKENNEEN